MTKVRSKSYKRVTGNLSEDVPEKGLDITSAVERAKKASYSKFPGKLELHLNLSIDPAKTDQRLNVTTTPPYSTGKSKKVAVIVPPEHKNVAEKAGADIVGGTDLIEEIKEGKINFDTLITTPDMMPQIASVARILGPKGLMPNPKNNTVTTNLESAIQNMKKGQITLRTTEEPILHLVVGNTSQVTTEVVANIEHLLNLVRANKPTKVKGELIKSAFLAPTMGPSTRLIIS